MKAEKTLRTAVYGGSFDPPHYGHYDIVKNLEKKFDRVIVVPSYISPFKTENEAADNAKVRLRLCKRFFTSQKTEVLAREINKKGVSYSVETAAFLKKKYPNEQLFWVIGSEEVRGLGDWHEIDRLKTLVTFFVVPRPGYAITDELKKRARARGIKIKIAGFDGLDIGSTQIKIDRAFGKPNKCVPDFVQKTADKFGLFDPYGKYVAALYKYNLSDKRLCHTYGVALRGAELAKMYGYPVKTAVIACILHDIAKSVNPDEYVGKVDAQGFPAPTVHGPIGAYIARREFGISDDMYHAIRYHSTGDGDMGLLDEIVYLADKTEPWRSYNEVYYFRYLCAVDRNYAMYKALNAVSEYQEARPCEYSSRAIALYAERCKGVTAPEMPKRAALSACENVSRLPIARDKNEIAHVKSKEVRIVSQPQKEVRVANQTSKEVGMSQKAVGGAVAVSPQSEGGMYEIATAVAQELSLHKAREIDIVGLEGKTIIADYFVIASVSSSTAVKAQTGYVEDIMTKKFGMDPLRRDIDSEWAALDYGGVIVHIFTDKMREFYNIERLWSDGGNITRIGE